jgi:hypothetical protein
VVRGLEPEAQETIDMGMPRNLSDILRFRGEERGQLLGATCKMVRQVIRDNMSTSRSDLSSTEILEILETNPEVRASVEIAWWSKGRSVATIQPSVLGTAHWMIARVNGIEEADAFITRVVTLQGEEEGSPVLALARRVNELKRVRARFNAKESLALVLKAWNYDAEGKHVLKLAYGRKGKDTQLPKVGKRKVPSPVTPDVIAHSSEEDVVEEPTEQKKAS